MLTSGQGPMQCAALWRFSLKMGVFLFSGRAGKVIFLSLHIQRCPGQEMREAAAMNPPAVDS